MRRDKLRDGQVLQLRETSRSRGSGQDCTGHPERGIIAGTKGGMLTEDILLGMNILTLAGFVVMGLTLTLNRMGQAGRG